MRSVLVGFIPDSLDKEHLYLGIDLFQLGSPPGVVDSEVRLDDAAALIHARIGDKLQVLRSAEDVGVFSLSVPEKVDIFRREIHDDALLVADPLQDSGENTENRLLVQRHFFVKHPLQKVLPQTNDLRRQKANEGIGLRDEGLVNGFESRHQSGKALRIFRGYLFFAWTRPSSRPVF